MRGGKRAGAGRHKLPPTVLMRLHLPVAVHEAVQALGGTIWAKRLIVEAVFMKNQPIAPVERAVVAIKDVAEKEL